MEQRHRQRAIWLGAGAQVVHRSHNEGGGRGHTAQAGPQHVSQRVVLLSLSQPVQQDVHSDTRGDARPLRRGGESCTVRLVSSPRHPRGTHQGVRLQVGRRVHHHRFLCSRAPRAAGAVQLCVGVVKQALRRPYLAARGAATQQGTGVQEAHCAAEASGTWRQGTAAHRGGQTPHRQSAASGSPQAHAAARQGVPHLHRASPPTGVRGLCADVTAVEHKENAPAARSPPPAPERPWPRAARWAMADDCDCDPVGAQNEDLHPRRRDELAAEAALAEGKARASSGS